MTNKILVTYASRTGWTVGVAEAIGKSLREDGTLVDVLPMQKVKDLSGYRAVVASSAIQDRQWLPEAVQFVREHREELRSKPFAAFMVCMTLAMSSGEKYRNQIAAWLDPVRSLMRPVSEGLFAGGLELKRIPSASARFKFRISVLMGVWKEGDHRDWKAIGAWAEKLRPLLKG